MPAALVQPRRLAVRRRDFAWPDEETVRSVAKRGRLGLRKVTVADEGRRVGLVAVAA